MVRRNTSTSNKHFELVEKIVAVFEAAKDTYPELKQADLDETIRINAQKHALFKGMFQGVPAVYRIYFDEPVLHSQRDWTELTRAADYMSEGPYQAQIPLFHAPPFGMVVTRFADGLPLLNLMKRMDEAERCEHISHVASWLRRYTEPTEAKSRARFDGWLKRARLGTERQNFEDLRPVKTEILKTLEIIAEERKGFSWRTAICHGDFHGNNLLYNDTHLVGIDTGGSARLPIYKDVARFLIHMVRQGVGASGEKRFGVDPKWLDAFGSVMNFDREEQDIWVPFMMGVEALQRVEAEWFKPGRVRRSKILSEDILADLQSVTMRAL